MKGYLAYGLDRCACERGEACDQHVPLFPHPQPGPTLESNGPGFLYGFCPMCDSALRGDHEIFDGVCRECSL